LEAEIATQQQFAATAREKIKAANAIIKDEGVRNGGGRVAI